MVLGKVDNHMQKKTKLDFYLTPLRKINSKWTKDLNIRADTVKSQEKTLRRSSWTSELLIVFWV